MHPSQNTDLSFDTVRVRLSALRKTAEIAVVYSRSQVENSIRKIQISFQNRILPVLGTNLNVLCNTPKTCQKQRKCFTH